ncbi:MAG: endonuclease/exonuclease/phosphatase family protein [Deltaproteobacteria bacterium]|nr:endonuclease/exonuclease/phosphatase family protein [Deltaproteobacteria bacterium]
MRIRVLSINIWNRSGPWDARLTLLRAGIEALAPDVIGMQEVMSDGTHSLADAVVEGLGYQTAYAEAKPLGGGITFGNAVLSRWPVAVREVVKLPGAGTDEQRSLLLTEVTTPGGPLPFLVTHLAWRMHHGFVREEQVRAIAAAIARHEPMCEDRLPLVLVGDFNARPDSSEVRFLTGLQSMDGTSLHLLDAFDVAGAGAGPTFDGRTNPFAAPMNEPPRRIDYVFLRGPDEWHRGSVVEARVVLDDVVDGVAASDHFGVLAVLDLAAPG